MDTRPISTQTLAASVIAVPPLARDTSLAIDPQQNAKIIRHLESGGVKTLLYGGNAVLGHVALSEYESLLAMLESTVAPETLVIPSVGPGFGMMMDQARMLSESKFPTAMLLPTNDPTTSSGLATAFRHFVERFGRPAVLYIKRDGYIDTDAIRRLMDDGLISWIKYAIVRPEGAEDATLRAIVDAVGTARVVSGMGEQPALSHLRNDRLAGFTSGCVCIAPRLSSAMLSSLHAGEYERAEQIRAIFRPLETLRDAISPVRVLHAAVELAGIARTGPIIPPLAGLNDDDRRQVAEAAVKLLEAENTWR